MSKKSSGRGGIAQKVRPDAELAAIVGDEPLTRAEVTQRMWAYIKREGLQDAGDRRRINADDKLRPLFGGHAQVSTSISSSVPRSDFIHRRCA
jgi:upstream activation factor subunit UAF30